VTTNLHLLITVTNLVLLELKKKTWSKDEDVECFQKKRKKVKIKNNKLI
jgi:hypothetical protein